MSEDSHPQEHHHQGFFERILHPGRHHQAEEREHHDEHESLGDESQKKESEFDKIKEDIKDDQEEVAEGDIYAGLM
ncbi:hypothetical protein BDV26DRAFT_296608 [Aspergillus bertholletiae]|uniref:Uncharacterized protein n=1 Tax=Aspergillus bertholletiae TaxID=1226010 RepID=A0A5N7AYA6_9EURO|nr:hypothetical protein BDV26DRAFT_296608 [Aspergillus bertholletiae]